MNTGVVSRRYAKALLDYAMNNGNEEKVYKEIHTLAGHFARVPELRKTVDNPVLSKDKKHALLVEAAGGEGISEELKRFFMLVLDGKREKFLQFMTWSFIDLYRERKHILVGKLITAVESPQLVEHIRKKAGEKTNSTVEIRTEIDPSIIGGFIMELDGYRLDASVDYQLRKVKRQFIEKNRRIV
ncbi:MAG: F0F1 ATP synthase subunit delta [Phocaeicola sp.]|nr:F0F1 ATP synthase subunit delta [Phocaeicola sp.]